jgi:hypothetical protein
MDTLLNYAPQNERRACKTRRARATPTPTPTTTLPPIALADASARSAPLHLQQQQQQDHHQRGGTTGQRPRRGRGPAISRPDLYGDD